MRKYVVFGLLILLSTPQVVHAADSGATSTPAAVITPAPVVKASSVATPTPTPAATPAAVVKTLIGELTKIRVMVGSKNYVQARDDLKIANKDFPNNADINNLLGFTSRKLKSYATAALYYKKALEINPKHLGALEYQGELFIITKKIALAKKNLVLLEQICGVNCEEYLDLKRAIGNK